MRNKKLFWYIFPPFLLIIIFTVASIYWWAKFSFRTFYIDQEKKELQTVIALLEKNWPDIPIQTDVEWQAHCNNLTEFTKSRVTIIALDGKVLGDSDENKLRMGPHGDRPEVVQASKSQMGMALRFSETLQTEMLYVAKLIKRNQHNAFILRISKPISRFDDQINNMVANNLWIPIFLLFAIFLTVLIVSKFISRPIEKITSGVQNMTKGMNKISLDVQGSLEIYQLTEAINFMSNDLKEKINMIAKQGNELSAVFASMKEGVIALNDQGIIIEMNESAKTYLDCKNIDVNGHTLSEVVRNSDINRIHRELQSAREVECDIHLLEPEKKIFQVRATQIQGADNELVGALFVIEDMTQLRKLENMRRQFVANVSHELKTPLTSIKGYVETLLSSPDIKDETVLRFLEKIESNSNRLNALIEDLLTLSRVEQEGLRPEDLENVNIKGVFENTLAELHPERFPDLKFDIECHPGTRVKAHPLLLNQAIFNLLENAAKYSDKKGTVTLKAFEDNGHVKIEVKDQGPGIDAKHLPHLLERFYRVDKARSRSRGGTGLGLSIVKHIVQAHAGKVYIESEVGKGSTFTLLFSNKFITNK